MRKSAHGGGSELRTYADHKQHFVVVEANVTRFSGVDYAAGYNQNRPTPPSVLIDIVRQYLGSSSIKTVVDVGSGTGLSTRFWYSKCDVVVGVEPNDDMRQQAQEATASQNLDAARIKYVKGHSAEVPLEDGSVDVIVCSQSLHWMEPVSTFKEAGRLLKKGGIFLSVDCDFPPVLNVDAERAYTKFTEGAQAYGAPRDLFEGVHKWRKEEHLNRMKNSGVFSYCKEIVLHNEETGGAGRLIGLALSQGQVATLLRSGKVTEDDIGVSEFKQTVQNALKDQTSWKWVWSYRVRLAVK